MPTLTPVPSNDLNILTRNVSKMGTQITRIESAVSTIRDDLLPPVSKAATEARDGFLLIEGRVTAIEDRPGLPHDCREETRQIRQDNDIAETKTTALGIGRLVWWLMGLLIVIGGSAFSFAVLTKTQTTENSTRIEAHTNDLARHERDIETIEKAQQRDREVYLKEVRNLPTIVMEASQSKTTVEDMQEAVDELPLSHTEQKQFIRLLEKARKRSDSNALNKHKRKLQNER